MSQNSKSQARIPGSTAAKFWKNDEPWTMNQDLRWFYSSSLLPITAPRTGAAAAEMSAGICITTALLRLYPRGTGVIYLYYILYIIYKYKYLFYVYICIMYNRPGCIYFCIHTYTMLYTYMHGEDPWNTSHIAHCPLPVASKCIYTHTQTHARTRTRTRVST